jgi:hypothetical protein
MRGEAPLRGIWCREIVARRDKIRTCDLAFEGQGIAFTPGRLSYEITAGRQSGGIARRDWDTFWETYWDTRTLPEQKKSK